MMLWYYVKCTEGLGWALFWSKNVLSLFRENAPLSKLSKPDLESDKKVKNLFHEKIVK